MKKEYTKKILVINGHPDSESLCSGLAQKYIDGAKSSGFETELLSLSDLRFNPNLITGYKNEQNVEPDIILSQKLISAHDHLVFIFPNWWTGMPALLKGFIDRIFLPGFAFSYRKNSPFPEQLLKGKTSRIIITMDSPVWYYRFFRRSAGLHSLKRGVLEYCGVKPVSHSLIGQVRRITPERLDKVFKNTFQLGVKGV